MRSSLLTSAVVLGLALTAPAFAQTSGTQNLGPNGVRNGTQTGQVGAQNMGQNGTQNGVENRAENTTRHRTRHFAERHRYIASPHRLIREGEMNPATGARWGHHPGIGESLPYSTHASNITPQDTRSVIAPTLPVPPTQNGSTDRFLNWARQALARHQTGLAQSNLEDAMTARLNGDEVRGASPADDPTIGAIQAALDDLAAHRWQGVDRRIAEAQSDARMAYGGNPGPSYGGNEYGMNGGQYGHPTSNFDTRFNGQDMNPIQQPPHRTMPGTLGVQSTPPGTQMNPTGSPTY
jgi:hypothetical protein